MSFARHRLRIGLFQFIVNAVLGLQRRVGAMTPPPFRLMQIGSAFWQSRALYAAARWGLADAIGDGQKGAKAVAEALGLHEDYVYRLLRMLGSLGVFREVSPGVFANTAMSEYLRADNEKSLRALILMHNAPQMTRPWTEALEPCMQSGAIPFEQVNGRALFEYMDRDADFDRLFSGAMDAVENLVGDGFLEDFDWGRFERIIDVGGSKGRKSIAILKTHPRLKALVFDRPQVIGMAREHWSGKVAGDILERMDFQGGDMLEAVPEARSGNDLYVLFAVAHAVDDDTFMRVLNNIRMAAGDQRPHVLFADAVAADLNVDPAVAAFDMQMLINTPGRERRLSEWRAVLDGAGFALIEVIDTRSFAKFILARPR